MNFVSAAGRGNDRDNHYSQDPEANKQRKQKELWTERGKGDPIIVFEAYNEEEEALFVAREAKRLQREASLHLGDIAVMYRTNAQSRAIEERCDTDP